MNVFLMQNSIVRPLGRDMQNVLIGFVGEHEARTFFVRTRDDLTGYTVGLVIDDVDCGAMTKAPMPDGSTMLSLTLTSDMLGKGGDKVCQILMVKDTIVRKSSQFRAYVGASNDINSTAPDSATIIIISEKITELVHEAALDAIAEVQEVIDSIPAEYSALGDQVDTNTAAIALKADKSTTYTKTEVDRMIEGVEVETDTTLEVAGAPADAAETGRQIGLLKADLGAVNSGLFILNMQDGSIDSDGYPVSSGLRKRSDYVEIGDNANIIVNSTTSGTLNRFYNANKEPLDSFTIAVGETVVSVPDGAKYFIISVGKNYVDGLSVSGDMRYTINTLAEEYATHNNFLYPIGLGNDYSQYVKYSDGSLVGTQTAVSYRILNKGYSRIKVRSGQSSASIASIAFYSSYTPTVDSYILANSVKSVGGNTLTDYVADVPTNAKLIIITTSSTLVPSTMVYAPMTDGYLYDNIGKSNWISELPKNPYQHINWSIVKDVPSVSHAHCRLPAEFATLKAHYKHIAISNYHPAVPYYPLDGYFSDVSGIIGSPNAEMSAFKNNGFRKTHMNPLGSVLTGSEGYADTEAEFVKNANQTRQYINGGGVTINHPAWSELTIDRLKYLAQLRGVIGMEIYNATCMRTDPPSGDSVSMWDEVLSDGIQIYGLAVPDHEAQTYDESEYGFGYNHLLVSNETEFECLNAYRMGKFYATIRNDGLTLISYGIDNNLLLSIEVSEASTYKFVTATRTVEVNTASTTATFQCVSTDGYVRCEAHRGNNVLYTNAIML